MVTAEAALSGQGNPTDHSLLGQSTSAIVLLLPKQVLEKSLYASKERKISTGFLGSCRYSHTAFAGKP